MESNMTEYYTHDEIQKMIMSLENGRYDFSDDKDLMRLTQILAKVPKQQAEKLLNCNGFSYFYYC